MLQERKAQTQQPEQIIASSAMSQQYTDAMWRDQTALRQQQLAEQKMAKENGTAAAAASDEPAAVAPPAPPQQTAEQQAPLSKAASAAAPPAAAAKKKATTPTPIATGSNSSRGSALTYIALGVSVVALIGSVGPLVKPDLYEADTTGIADILEEWSPLPQAAAAALVLAMLIAVVRGKRAGAGSGAGALVVTRLVGSSCQLSRALTSEYIATQPLCVSHPPSPAFAARSLRLVWSLYSCASWCAGGP